MTTDPKLRAMQLTQNEMLKELKRLCDKHGLKYYLAQGTLLGAVRHKGFIPWDDDADVLMPYSHIKRLQKIFEKEGSSNLFFQNPETDLFSPLQWSKIRMNNTTSMPAANRFLPIHWGICIDIFPLFDLSDNKYMAKLQWLGYKVNNRVLLKSILQYTDKPNVLINKMRIFSAKTRRLAYRLITKTLLLPERNGKRVFAMCKGGKVFDKKIFEDPGCSFLEFEGETYSAPCHYHEYLTGFFGDYMTLPPESERVGHDMDLGEIIWDNKRNYSEYTEE